MKRTIAIAALLCALPISNFAQRWVGLAIPQDDPAARWAVCERVELKPRTDEYQQIIETHFRPLKVEDITKIFGPKLEEHGIEPGGHLATDVVLPLFEPMMVGLSGLLVTNDLSHRVLYAVGDIGCVEFFYHCDGISLATVVFYAHSDDKFVPLKTADDLPERMEWDKKKFEAFKQWVDEHMPKITDLGEVEVAESSPSRVVLGSDTASIITTRVIHHPNVPLWFTIDLAKETTNTEERLKSMQNWSISRTNQSVGFSIDGKFYRLTPKLVKQLHGSNN
jgi:hypothetical protein